MNMLFVLGNGFDINLGYKTSYQDFYQYYTNTKSASEDQIKLKNIIKSDSANWADLELALGKYSKQFDDPIEFELLFESIQNELANFIDEQQRKIEFDPIFKDILINDFCFPELSLPPGDQAHVSKFIKDFGYATRQIQIVTFNYTNTLERILGNLQNSVILTKDKINYRSGKFIHIHGTTSHHMIMGLNDISQIENEKFKSEINLNELIVKTHYNKVTSYSYDDDFQTAIDNSDIICIYGSSLGDTDNHWWSSIINHVKEKGILIIYYYDGSLNERFMGRVGRIKRGIISRLVKLGNLSQSEASSIQNKIFVAVNSNMFK